MAGAAEVGEQEEGGDDGERLKRRGGEAWREQGLQFRFRCKSRCLAETKFFDKFWPNFFEF